MFGHPAAPTGRPLLFLTPVERDTTVSPESEIQRIRALFTEVKRGYDLGENRLRELGELGVACLNVLARESSIVNQGTAQFGDAEKEYIAWDAPPRRSRPIRKDLFIAEPKKFAATWKKMLKAIDPKQMRLPFRQTDAALYTATQSFSCVIDLLQRGSRKVPGTHFEVLIGSFLGAVTGLNRGKQVQIPGEACTVPTDIVLLRNRGDDGPVLVVPTKITTRERVVQPFVHQRILDEVFGHGKYRSVLVMVSEVQRDDAGRRGLNEICVPNQVGLYQKHLGQLSGFYYLDVPGAYAKADFAQQLPVRTVGKLLGSDLPTLLTS